MCAEGVEYSWWARNMWWEAQNIVGSCGILEDGAEYCWWVRNIRGGRGISLSGAVNSLSGAGNRLAGAEYENPSRSNHFPVQSIDYPALSGTNPTLSGIWQARNIGGRRGIWISRAVRWFSGAEYSGSVPVRSFRGAVWFTATTQRTRRPRHSYERRCFENGTVDVPLRAHLQTALRAAAHPEIALAIARLTRC
jgi:hypothetical protein